MIGGVSDEAFWEGFHYRAMSQTDEALDARLATDFLESFAEAALLVQPNREAIRAELELEVGEDADGRRAIQVGFRFAGSRQTAEWDGSDGDAEALVIEAAQAIAESLSLDPHEDDDWRLAFERRS
jgi:hypothetical protein